MKIRKTPFPVEFRRAFPLVYLYNKKLLVGGLVGVHLLSRDFGPCGIILMTCVSTTSGVPVILDGIITSMS
jgi:hypothetical protein